MMVTEKTKIIVPSILLILLFIHFYKSYQTKNDANIANKSNGNSVVKTSKNDLILQYIGFEKFDSNPDIYKSQCEQILKKLRNPDPETLFEVPPRQPPQHLKDAFEQFGDLPRKGSRYLNEKYSGVKTESILITNKTLEEIQNRAKNKIRYGSYGDVVLQALFEKYAADYIKDKSSVVIGTQKPWIEALALMYGSSSITTLDYTVNQYEHPNMKWQLVNDFLDKALETKQFEQFDVSASFSSIEHSGLGRYGDPLSPFGDVDAVREVHCILKPGGLFFLGLPWHSNGYLEFNAHRYYGPKRMEILLKDWKVLEARKSNTYHKIFVLQKI